MKKVYFAFEMKGYSVLRKAFFQALEDPDALKMANITESVRPTSLATVLQYVDAMDMTSPPTATSCVPPLHLAVPLANSKSVNWSR